MIKLPSFYVCTCTSKVLLALNVTCDLCPAAASIQVPPEGSQGITARGKQGHTQLYTVDCRLGAGFAARWYGCNQIFLYKVNRNVTVFRLPTKLHLPHTGHLQLGLGTSGTEYYHCIETALCYSACVPLSQLTKIWYGR